MYGEIPTGSSCPGIQQSEKHDAELSEQCFPAHIVPWLWQLDYTTSEEEVLSKRLRCGNIFTHMGCC